MTDRVYVPPVDRLAKEPSVARLQFRIFSLIFFVSGGTSLVYQVAWVRELSLFFGSDVYSAAITLAAFMGGLGCGSWLAGRAAGWLRRPLLAYGILEILIAFYVLAFPSILGLFDPMLSATYDGSQLYLPPAYQATRAVAAFLVLVLPTALMGATLPIIIQHFAVSQRRLGSRVGHFYALNTLGALTGTVASGFLLLPLLGVKDSMAIAASLNLLAGCAAIGMGLAAAPGTRPAIAAVETRSTPAPGRRLVLLALALSGFAALAMEVAWMRILVQSFSATAYAFSIMLACFLLGIFLGSRAESKQVDARPDPARRLIQIEISLAVYVAALAIVIVWLPDFFGTFLWGLAAITGGNFGVASVASQAIAAGLLILLPTIWLGASFPLAVKVYARDIKERAADTGSLYAANTIGALLGALCAGFLFIPLVGARFTLLVIAGIFLLAAFVLLPLAARTQAQGGRRPIFACTAAGLAFAIVALALPQRIVANFNMQTNADPTVIYHGEGVAHTVDIIRTASDDTLMMVNGNIEADTTLVQRRHFILKAHLPLLLHPDPKDVGVIGLGLGITLSAMTRNPAVQDVRLIELSPEMVEAHEQLRSLTGDVLADPRVHLLIDDGRNFLDRSPEKFDVITVDPIHPRISGVGYLYTREYYEAARAHLKDGGYILQWMPMYAVSRKSFDVALRTFAGVFPHASFWYVRGHGLLVGSTEPMQIDFAQIVTRMDHPALRRDFDSIGMHSPYNLMAHLLMDERHIALYLASAGRLGDEINTDDNAYLEYHTPHEFLEQTRSILEALVPFAGWDRSILVNASAIDIAAIDHASAARLSILFDELDSPID